jgi:hypothetical protein
MTGKSGRGTARQTFRYDEQKWAAVGAAAEAAGTDRTTLIRDFLDWTIGDAKAPAPHRLVEPGDDGPGEDD